MKQQLFSHIKNIPGWHTKRKLVVFAVDDYGNVRLDSADARKELDKLGFSKKNRFDAYDTLETKEDLDALFSVLNKFKDNSSNPPVFTAYTLTNNLDFNSTTKDINSSIKSELLPVTFEKLAARFPSAYEGAWGLWNEGIDKGFVVPQFHGREHFNQQLFHNFLKEGNAELRASIANNSIPSISVPKSSILKWTASFSHDEFTDLDDLKRILVEGTENFREIFNFSSKTFTPPAHKFPDELEPYLKNLNYLSIDKPLYQFSRRTRGKSVRKLNFLGYNSKLELSQIVRNVVFEPTASRIDHTSRALSQIGAAFRMRKPAIISSHRVNYCGHIDKNNRNEGINALERLIKTILKKWPEAEFISADTLAELIHKPENDF